MHIPDKAEAIGLMIRDIKYYGNKLYRFIFYEQYLPEE